MYVSFVKREVEAFLVVVLPVAVSDAIRIFLRVTNIGFNTLQQQGNFVVVLFTISLLTQD